ncbi:hypothetical protein AB1Y20_000950 [Prymnesium parvum]|uniref:Zn(2)-C6 fungal-type domain-containing protein n=1 Tax=Prymnesium parvum TaxID=97485 RepID=A0AB34K6W8_PRYPA|mmetsp:Transcript_8425/g.20196  ORF Transcript_8425/g.20196 Transcript_8425/m.20196 type:complete len:402 (-) Transcript_8425:773-1978(-)
MVTAETTDAVEATNKEQEAVDGVKGTEDVKGDADDPPPVLAESQTLTCEDTQLVPKDVTAPVADTAGDEPNESDMEPLEPQDEFYPSGERKRVRSACVACHERKLRCVMLKKGVCRHCTEKQRTCTPRIEKKRGRPRNSELRSRPHFYMASGINQLAQIGMHPGCDPNTLGSMPNLSGLQAAQLQQSGSHMMAMPAMANGVVSGGGQPTNFLSQGGGFNQQNVMTPHILPNGQIVMVMPAAMNDANMQGVPSSNAQMVTAKPMPSGANGQSMVVPAVPTPMGMMPMATAIPLHVPMMTASVLKSSQPGGGSNQPQEMTMMPASGMSGEQSYGMASVVPTQRVDMQSFPAQPAQAPQYEADPAMQSRAVPAFNFDGPPGSQPGGPAFQSSAPLFNKPSEIAS